MSGRAGLARALDHARRRGCRSLLGRGFRQAETVYETTQWLPAAAVHSQQWAHVQVILEAAYHSSPFYRRRLDKAGWPVSSETFRHIPPLTRRDIDDLAFEIGRLNGRGLHRFSGGSSGAAVTIPLDRETYGWYIAGTWRGFRWWGAEPADRALLLLGRSAGSPLHMLAVRFKDWLMNWQRIYVNDQFDRKVPQILDDIELLRPTVLYGYPSAVHRLAEASRDRGWRSRRRLGLVVLTGEPVYAFQRRTIGEIFECPVAEEYGAGELGSMAFECPHGGLHVTAENVLLEIVPTPSLGTVGTGRILATQLHNRLFPLIRYETEDVGVMNSDPCRCGRGLPTLRVLGRIPPWSGNGQDMAIAHHRMERFFTMLPDHVQGRVRVAKSARGPLVLQVERGTASRADLAHVAAIGVEVLSAGQEVKVEEVEPFPRLPSGKLPYVLGSPA